MATSGVDRSDRNPEDAYDVDLRRIAPEDRQELRKGGINRQQGPVTRALKAAKAAGRYKMGTMYNQPLRDDGSVYLRGGAAGYDLPVPGRGDAFGPVGGYSYAEKPKRPMGAGPAFGF